MIVKAPIFSLPPQTSYFETLILNGFFPPKWERILVPCWEGKEVKHTKISHFQTGEIPSECVLLQETEWRAVNGSLHFISAKEE